MKMNISPATRRNWTRLNTDANDRLTKRANKTGSTRRILPEEYLTDPATADVVRTICGLAEEYSWESIQVVYTLGTELLRKAGILSKPHVRKVLSEYALHEIPQLTALQIPTDERDLLGACYQSLLTEGTRNRLGTYYTPHDTAKSMTAGLDMSNKKTLLDPCCGSGSFLIAAPCDDPAQLFGCDCDPAAVLAAKINLLLKFREREFTPQIICADFLALPHSQGYDHIVTNPPWGAVSDRSHIIDGAAFNETFSCFFVHAFSCLNEHGTIRFLLPSSVLNVKAHSKLRRFMLERTRIEQITLHDGAFSGVVTSYIDVKCSKDSPQSTVSIVSSAGLRNISTECFRLTDGCVFSLLNDTEHEIIRQMLSHKQYTLSQSRWALGIVTGDNKRMLNSLCEEGCEPIYTGKQIERYMLLPAKCYIRFDRSQLQQAAPNEMYRAPEKLVYRFISDRPVFAYDASGGLFLNSANILIPDIPNMCIKTVMAFLNSQAMQFFYQKLFGEIKTLKGNLLQLPFPKISQEQDTFIENAVKEILNGDPSADGRIQEEIFRAYDLTDVQVKHIKNDLTKG